MKKGFVIGLFSFIFVVSACAGSPTQEPERDSSLASEAVVEDTAAANEVSVAKPATEIKDIEEVTEAVNDVTVTKPVPEVKGVEEVKPRSGVSARDFISTNFGVESLTSVTFDIDMSCQSSDYFYAYEGFYAQDGGYARLYLKENNSVTKDIYYDIHENVSYDVTPIGTIVTALDDAFDMRSANFIEFIDDLELDVYGDYEIKGKIDPEFVSKYVKLEGVDFSDARVYVKFVYDCATEQLQSVRLSIYSANEVYTIRCHVRDVNSTIVVLPFTS